MKKLTSSSALFLMAMCCLLESVVAQKPIVPDPTFYVDSLNRYYMQADLPVFLSISHDLDSEGQKLAPSDQGDVMNERKAIYMDGHGKHKLRHMDGHQGKTLDAFTIYADGRAPKTYVRPNDAPIYKGKDRLFFGAGLVLSLEARDEMSGLKRIYISKNKEPFGGFVDDIEVSQEGDYLLQYYATDRVGNTEATKQYRFTLDLTPPKTYYHIVGIAKNQIISTSTRLYLTSSDSLSGVAHTYYRFDEDEWKVYSGSDLDVAQLADGHHTLSYYSVDMVNNKAANEQLKFYLDKTAPIVSADVLGDKFIVGDKVYYSGRTKLKLTAVDNKSGIKDVLYAIDNDEFGAYTDPFYLPGKTGKHIVKYFARDNVDNDKKYSEYKHVVGIVYVDLTGPDLNYVLKGAHFKKGNMHYISAKTDVVLQASDRESGLKQIKYRIDGSEELDYVEPLNIEEDGLHKITIVGYDNVNNRNVEHFECTVDNVPSDIFVTYSASPMDTINQIPVYPSYTSIFLAGTDAGTECHRISYSINGQAFQVYDNKITGFKKNVDVELRIVAEDKVNNKSEIVINFKTNSL